MIAEPVPGVKFQVQVDDASLGLFDSCEGLSCAVEVEQRQEGGNNAYVWQLPTRITYSNITLRRPLSRDTEKVAQWISAAAAQPRRCTANITAMTADGTVITRWGLIDVIPVRWEGPSFTPDSAGVLTETVEIAHHGFLGS